LVDRLGSLILDDRGWGFLASGFQSCFCLSGRMNKSRAGCPERRTPMRRATTWSRAGLGLLLLYLVALQPSRSFSEGAVAFGQWGNGAWAYGSGYNKRTQSEAQAAAMNNCNQRGYNCAVRSSFRKTCFAIAVQDTNNDCLPACTRVQPLQTRKRSRAVTEWALVAAFETHFAIT
jgi:hypothetical protein